MTYRLKSIKTCERSFAGKTAASGETLSRFSFCLVQCWVSGHAALLSARVDGAEVQAQSLGRDPAGHLSGQSEFAAPSGDRKHRYFNAFAANCLLEGAGVRKSECSRKVGATEERAISLQQLHLELVDQVKSLCGAWIAQVGARHP